MAYHRSHDLLPRKASDPEFDRQFQLWADEAQRELTETIMDTKQMIATSRALLTDIDRLLALR